MFRIITEGPDYKEYVLLKNGQGLHIQPATEKDIHIVELFVKRISPESLRMRFMASTSYVPQSVIKEFCSGDFIHKGCLLAITGEGDEKRVVGLGNYIDMGDEHSAEVAFLIEDAFQGNGISTLLLERIAGIAAANGFIDLEFEILPDNDAMINVIKSSGFKFHQVWNSDTVHIELPVYNAAALWERTELHERIAVANSLQPLLRPKITAVIGVSRDYSSLGNMIFRNILSANYLGTVYPVNPQAVSVNGIKSYSSVKDIPDKIDLAVIAVRADKVISVAEDAIDAGAKGLVVVSAGFADAGEEGRIRQNQLTELVRSRGVRLLGPGCLGLMNTNPEIRLNASLAPRIMPPGHTGFFSHSAALGLVIMDYALEKGISFSTFVSAGNRADVSGNDLLQYWEEDTDTKMAILYLETFGNPRRFVRIARRMTYKKPVLCVKSARSLAGRKTAEAKSGAHAGGSAEVEALFQQTGMIIAPTLEDLFDVALVITHQPLPKGDRVCVIANSAGMSTLFADACEMNSLRIDGPGIVNLGAFSSPQIYEESMTGALLDENVDSVLVGFACVGNCSADEIAQAIRISVIAAKEKNGVEKPVLLCLMGALEAISLFDESNSDGSERKLPAFRFPELAVNALGRIVRYVEFHKQPLGKLIWYDDVKAAEARLLVQKIIARTKQQSSLIEFDEEESKELTAFFGISSDVNRDEPLRRFDVGVRPDPLFGPIIEIKSNAMHSVLRITPLTDRDLDDIVMEMNLEKEGPFYHLLGRLSQMVEDIPWLWALKAEVKYYGNSFSLQKIAVTIKAAGIERPAY